MTNLLAVLMLAAAASAQEEAPASIEAPPVAPAVEAAEAAPMASEAALPRDSARSAAAVPVQDPVPAPPAPAAAPAAATAATAQLKFLENAFASAGKETLPALLEQVEVHLGQHRSAEGADEALYLKARIQEASGDLAAAAATLLKTLYLHPDTRAALAVKKDLLRIADKRFKRIKRELVEASRYVGEGLDASQREAAFLFALSALRDPGLQAPLIAEAGSFLRREPAHPSSGEATFLVAQAYEALGRHAEALLVYRKTLALFPDKGLAVRTQAAIGDLYAKTKDYDKAVEAYQAVADRHAGGPEAGPAYLKMAEILEKNLKQPSLAAEVLEKAVQIQPKAPAALAALREQARIHKESKDFARQAKTLERIAEGFPDDKGAPEALWEAALVYEEKVEDAALARKAYARLLDKYPVGQLARKARKRLDTLNQ